MNKREQFLNKALGTFALTQNILRRSKIRPDSELYAELYVLSKKAYEINLTVFKPYIKPFLDYMNFSRPIGHYYVRVSLLKILENPSLMDSPSNFFIDTITQNRNREKFLAILLQTLSENKHLVIHVNQLSNAQENNDFHIHILLNKLFSMFLNYVFLVMPA